MNKEKFQKEFQPERLKQVLAINLMSLNTLCYNLNLNVKYMTEILEGRRKDIEITQLFVIASYLNVKWQFFYTLKPHFHIRNITAVLH